MIGMRTRSPSLLPSLPCAVTGSPWLVLTGFVLARGPAPVDVGVPAPRCCPYRAPRCVIGGTAVVRSPGDVFWCRIPDGPPRPEIIQKRKKGGGGGRPG